LVIPVEIQRVRRLGVVFPLSKVNVWSWR